MTDATDATEAARRIVAAADHYLASGKAHGFTSATAEQAAECYTAVIEKDADVVARALLAGHDDVVERCERAAREAANKILGNRSHYALIGPGGVAHAMTAAIRALRTKP